MASNVGKMTDFCYSGSILGNPHLYVEIPSRMEIRVGDLGQAASVMCPSGVIIVHGERFSARTEGQYIEPGTPVILLRQESGGYVVRPLTDGEPPPQLPQQGKPIGTPLETQMPAAPPELIDQKVQEKRVLHRKELQHGSIAAAALGGLVWLSTVGLAFSGTLGERVASRFQLSEGNETSLIIGLFMVLLFACLLGVLLFFVSGMVGGLFGTFEEGTSRFSPSLSAILAGLIGAVVAGISQLASGDFGTIALWTGGVGLGMVVVVHVLWEGVWQLLADGV